MKLKKEITPEIAECVGLWLAEGDTKSDREITFTNNCLALIEFFAKTIQIIFKELDLKTRIYVYSAKKEKIQLNINCKTNYYTDKRARTPYFIFRIGSINATRQWTNLVETVINDERFYVHIIRGFFAGKGNLKEGNHSNRTIRIAQGKPNKLIEQILKHCGITYQYIYHERAYYITGKWNWDKIAKNKISDLHPIKREKFWRMFNSFKEIHYPDHYLRDNVLKLLNKPYTSSELSKRFKRSQARIQDILILLKKENKPQAFRVGSKTYWIKNDQNKIIISGVKNNYLKTLKKSRKNTGNFAKEIGVCWKAAYKRLTELQKLNLVIRDSNGIWGIIPSKKEVVVL